MLGGFQVEAALFRLVGQVGLEPTIVQYRARLLWKTGRGFFEILPWKRIRLVTLRFFRRSSRKLWKAWHVSACWYHIAAIIPMSLRYRLRIVSARHFSWPAEDTSETYWTIKIVLIQDAIKIYCIGQITCIRVIRIFPQIKVNSRNVKRKVLVEISELEPLTSWMPYFTVGNTMNILSIMSP